MVPGTNLGCRRVRAPCWCRGYGGDQDRCGSGPQAAGGGQRLAGHPQHPCKRWRGPRSTRRGAVAVGPALLTRGARVPDRARPRGAGHPHSPEATWGEVAATAHSLGPPGPGTSAQGLGVPLPVLPEPRARLTLCTHSSRDQVARTSLEPSRKNLGPHQVQGRTSQPQSPCFPRNLEAQPRLRFRRACSRAGTRGGRGPSGDTRTPWGRPGGSWSPPFMPRGGRRAGCVVRPGCGETTGTRQPPPGAAPLTLPPWHMGGVRAFPPQPGPFASAGRCTSLSPTSLPSTGACARPLPAACSAPAPTAPPKASSTCPVRKVRAGRLPRGLGGRARPHTDATPPQRPRPASRPPSASTPA